MRGLGSCHDQFCGAAFLLLLPVFMGVGAVVGAVTSAPSAASPDALASGQKAMDEGIAKLDLQRGVEGAVANELRTQGVAANVAEEWEVGPATPEERPTYESVNPQTRDAILEVSVLGFQFKKAQRPDSKKLNYRLSMETRIRLLAPASRAVLDEMVHVYESDPGTATEWLTNGARRFESALKAAIGETAQSAVHEMFLLYHPEIPPASASPGGQLVPDYVLQPLYPVPVQSLDLRGAFMDRYKTGWGNLQFVAVDDLRPTLKWEAFPRPLDVAGAGGEAKRFDAVRYEVAIYEARSLAAFYEPGALIRRHTGLTEPAYRLDKALQPCARYFWSVRAHFMLDGWPRVTDWTGAYNAFQTAKPWEYRRGLMTGPFYRPGVEPRLMFLPFRAPTGFGTTCN